MSYAMTAESYNSYLDMSAASPRLPRDLPPRPLPLMDLGGRWTGTTGGCCCCF